MYWMMETMIDRKDSADALGYLSPAIYNVGTGKARTFNDLVIGYFSKYEARTQD